MAEQRVVLIAASDIHLSLTPPVARSSEEDWLAVQKRYLKQLGKLTQVRQEDDGNVWFEEVPIVYAGDLFDRWNSSAELINFALTYLPKGYAIPGQHDLPNHSLAHIKRSAFWTMVEAGKLVLLDPKKPLELGNVRLHAFPWGVKVAPLLTAHDLLLEVAVIHSFIYSKSTGYVGAPETNRMKKWRAKLRGYDVALFGDNHITTTYNLEKKKAKQVSIFNPGSFLRRKRDEIEHKPVVGLVCSDGSIKRHYLDCSKDKFLDTQTPGAATSEISLKIQEFVTELSQLQDVVISFEEAIKRWLESHQVDEEVSKVLLTTLEGKC